MEDLFLILKKNWYDDIERIFKPEEYREITAYWVRRLISFARYPKEAPDDCKTFAEDIIYDWVNLSPGVVFQDILDAYGGDFKQFKTVTFQHGYPKLGSTGSRRMTFEFLGIEVREGKKEWGAEPGVFYFVIKLGKRLA